jgi:hypothetical protein
MATKKSRHVFKTGDWVKIRYSEWQGRIVEERGDLGPGGKLVFRVRIPLRPKPKYIELLEDQLVYVPRSLEEVSSSNPNGPNGEPGTPEVQTKKVH